MSDAIDGLRSDFNDFINEHGTTISIQNKTVSVTGSDYDTGTFANSGTVVTGSAFMMPVTPNKSADDKRFIEQGIIEQTDRKVFMPSTLTIDQNADVVIDSGSWKVVDKGIIDVPTTGELVYRKAYVRSLRP